MGYKVLIVDDELQAINNLVLLLEESFPELEICATAQTSEKAIQLAYRKHPDLIFLDIKIDKRNGFDIVKELEKEEHFPYIVFVTAHDQFAVNAFKFNAFDYLLKPVDKQDLERVINKFITQKEKDVSQKNVFQLLSKFQPKIRFNTRQGYILISPDDIVYCESDGNYTNLHLNDRTKKIVCYNLKNLLKLLPDTLFRRISRYNIINENYLIEVDRGKKVCILSIDGGVKMLNYSSKMFF